MEQVAIGFLVVGATLQVAALVLRMSKKDEEKELDKKD